MEKLLLLGFDLLLFVGYLLIGVSIALLIQLISYRVFKVNLYKKLIYILFTKEGVR